MRFRCSMAANAWRENLPVWKYNAPAGVIITGAVTVYQRIVAGAGKRDDMTGSAESDLLGKADQVAVERGLAEFAAGRPVILPSRRGSALVLPVDGLTDAILAGFRQLCAPARPYLLITARRARALDLDGAGPTGLALGDLHDAAAILSLAAGAQVTRQLDVVPVGETASAAIELAKLAQQLPALLVGNGEAAAVRGCDPPLVSVAPDAVAQFRRATDET